MKMAGIRIDRIEIRLRSLSPELVRSACEGLGKEILEQLVAKRLFLNEKSGLSINRIAPDTLKIGGDNDPSDLRRIIAGRIAESVSAQKRRKTSGKGGTP